MEEQKPPKNRMRRAKEKVLSTDEQLVGELDLPTKALSVLENEGIIHVSDFTRLSADNLFDLLGKEASLLVLKLLISLGKRHTSELVVIQVRSRRPKVKKVEGGA